MDLELVVPVLICFIGFNCERCYCCWHRCMSIGVLGARATKTWQALSWVRFSIFFACMMLQRLSNSLLLESLHNNGGTRHTRYKGLKKQGQFWLRNIPDY
jgi:hypothetical protein